MAHESSFFSFSSSYSSCSSSSSSNLFVYFAYSLDTIPFIRRVRYKAKNYGNSPIASENETWSMFTTTTGGPAVESVPVTDPLLCVVVVPVVGEATPETIADVGEEVPGVPGARITFLSCIVGVDIGVEDKDEPEPTAAPARSRIGLVPEYDEGDETIAEGISVTPLLFPEANPGVNVIKEEAEGDSVVAIASAGSSVLPFPFVALLFALYSAETFDPFNEIELKDKFDP